MKIEELIKDLDPISIIEFKNYLLEHLTELCCKKDSKEMPIDLNIAYAEYTNQS